MELDIVSQNTDNLTVLFVLMIVKLACIRVRKYIISCIMDMDLSLALMKPPSALIFRRKIGIVFLKFKKLFCAATILSF